MLTIQEVCGEFDHNERTIRQMVEAGYLHPASMKPMLFSADEVGRAKEDISRQKRFIRQIVDMDEDLES